jgi:hypothetical protein
MLTLSGCHFSRAMRRWRTRRQGKRPDGETEQSRGLLQDKSNGAMGRLSRCLHIQELALAVRAVSLQI